MYAERLVKFQGTMYLPEDDFQDVRKEYGAISSLVKTGGIVYKKKNKKLN